MNLEFENAKQWSIYANLDPNAEDGSEHSLTYELPNDKSKIIEHSYILVKGDRLRFVHVADRVNMLNNMRKQIDIYQNMRAKANAPRINWKMHRKQMRLEKLQHKLTGEHVNSDNVPSQPSSSFSTPTNTSSNT